jgi:hypothetical protein
MSLSFLAGLACLFLSSLPAARAQDTVQLLDINTNVWSYNDSGADLGTAWRDTSYLENPSWRAGVGLFGVEPTVPYPYPVPVRTPLVLGAGRMTYYFRTHFAVTQSPSGILVSGTAYVDDGAVFYVNGTEVGRVRLTNNPVHNTNRALVAIPEGVAVSFSVPSSALVQGDNVIAVEVHQNAVTSADVIFGLQLQATMAEAPRILTLNEPSDRTVPQGESTVLTVAGAGAPAPVYYWYHNGVFDPRGNGSALALNEVGAADAGAYHVVLSNFLGTATSRTAQVNVLLDTNAPAILYALGSNDLTRILLVFSEAPNFDQATDPFAYLLQFRDGSDSGLFVYSADLTDGTNVTLTTDARDPSVRYNVTLNGPIGDRFGNELPVGTTIPVASFINAVVPLAQSWRYEQSGTDLGTSWRGSAFNDSAWSSGPAPLDVIRFFPDSLPPFCRTGPPELPDNVGTCLLTLSNANSSAQLPAMYFRTKFNFSGDAAHTVLHLQALVDDGAVFYLNGVELCRVGMPGGPVAYTTFAARTVINATNETFDLSGAGLLQGENVLAVEVHQDGPTSPDLTFALRLDAIVPEIIAPRRQALIEAPRMAFNVAAGDVAISWTPAGGLLQAASEPIGPWSVVSPSHPPDRHSERANVARRFFRVLVP